MNNEVEKPAGFAGWLKESVTVKLVFIGVLILVLLIPSSMISNLINERADRQQEVIKDVSYNFAGDQQVKGPVLVIPYTADVNGIDQGGKLITKQVIQNLYVLPDDLYIKANVKSEIVHRGIFDAVVYKSRVNVTGNFTKADLNALGLTPGQLMLDKQKLPLAYPILKG
jgi:inner membrane protein